MNNDNPNIDFKNAWGKLKPQLEAEAENREKKKRRFVLFWWSIASIAVLGFAGYLLNTHFSNNEKIIANKNSISNNNEKNIEEIKNTTSKNLNEENQKIENQKTKKVAEEKSIVIKLIQVQRESVSIKSSNQKTKIIKTKKVEENNALQQRESNKILANKIENLVNIEKENYQKTKGIVNSNFNNNKNSNEVNKNLKIVKPANSALSTKNFDDPTNGITLLPVPQKKKRNNSLSFGVKFNAPFLFGANSLDYNANAQPFAMLIPTVFVTKTFNKKHSIQFQINPYNQYFANNKVLIKNNFYNLTLQQGSTINNNAQQIEYNEITTANKVIAIEFGASYFYQLKQKIKVGFGLFNNISTAAVLQNAVVKDKQQTTQTKNFGISQADNEWKYINNNFLVSKLEAMYQFKKFDVGLSVSKPLSNVFSNVQVNANPINTNLFLQYRF